MTYDRKDNFYADDFGERINDANALDDDAYGEDDMILDDTVSDDRDIRDNEAQTRLDEGFHETLDSEHIGDQLDDPSLQHEAEADLPASDRETPGDDMDERDRSV